MEKHFFVMVCAGHHSWLNGPFTEEEAEEMKGYTDRRPDRMIGEVGKIIDMRSVHDPQETLASWRRLSETWPK